MYPAGSAVMVIRTPARAAATMRCRKKRWAGKGGMPYERTGPCADTTNVRSSAAAVTPVNDTYGLGGVTLARTAPVRVDRSSAAVSVREEEPSWFSTSD